ncbi:hypothetical protein GCM10011583_23880 [Streptomyces camponoticapitis]|uniref:Uncharacterized protein n=1 Tax=Streptomyces camponoticapitis TaxID=1616125 RepID=A0ABQ2E343_9ACTN|nr:hypothetical protein [Streptomyces camponoticapitis]GGJ91676.1 hypothetical protein GCM10011583_23880 [Streptomyces camponoticapitis]
MPTDTAPADVCRQRPRLLLDKEIPGRVDVHGFPDMEIHRSTVAETVN